ncbi:lariat debranching enzyme [Scaptodrosophila lebanonensis]|uniref:Lariat debranching enzyme n=1 Tax=Drosophila lebanonensis TaxID=7225 RepID=A0A6J2T7A4_DROLE|nr:lariat debranching enzyme [Scaptodrosophila lebanonensis]
MRIAVEGCAHGELENIYDTIKGIEKSKNIKIDLLLCCGDFQSTRNLEDLQTMAVPKKYMDICSFYKYYNGQLVAPVLTIFIGGNHEASNYLQELPYGGWVAPNIYYLGYAGVVNVNGIRIAGISGIYKGHDFLRGRHEFPPYTQSSCRSVYHVRQLEVFRMKQLSGKIDIFMSHDWPRGIWDYGNKEQLIKFKPYFKDDMESGKLGSRPLEELLKSVRPTYWFAAHLHCKFAALVPHHVEEDADQSDDDNASSESENEKSHSPNAVRNSKPVSVTKFLALDKCLPKRRFLQVVEMETTTESKGVDINLEYDVEWLAILLTTNHLLSIKNNNYYLPGKKAGNVTERFNFTPTSEELELARSKFPNLNIPQNFCRTVPPFDPMEQSNYKHLNVNQPSAQLNPQCTEFCTLLGIDDPLALAMLANGKEVQEAFQIDDDKDVSSELDYSMDTSWENSSILSTPLKRKLNLSLPAPASEITREADHSVIELPEETEIEVNEIDKHEIIDERTGPIEELQTDDATVKEETIKNDVNPAAEAKATPNMNKFKRRNQSIYQADDNDV